jgi:hypothetical protein
MRLLPVLWLTACAGGGVSVLGKTGATSATDADTDTDADADTDSDADVDTDPTDTAPPVDPHPPTWTVDCGGTADFTTIQAAIDAAVSGDRIGLKPCTYDERFDYLGKSVEIYGMSGSAVTTVDGGGLGTVVSAINAEGLGTRLAGVTITGAVGAPAVVAIDANLELEDVVLTGNGPSLRVIDGEGAFLDLSDVTVTGNDVDATGAAIGSDGGGLTIDHAIVSCDGGRDAIFHHNQLILADSTVSCASGYGVENHHGEDDIRRSTIIGGTAGVLAGDTVSTPDLPDLPEEEEQIYNSTVIGGTGGADIAYMDGELVNSVFSGSTFGVSLLQMDATTVVDSCGLAHAQCGIDTDDAYAGFTWDGFYVVDRQVCGASPTNAILGDPVFTVWPTDLHLGAGSAWIDQGNPVGSMLDSDGTRNDIGIYGGPGAP